MDEDEGDDPRGKGEVVPLLSILKEDKRKTEPAASMEGRLNQ